MKTIVFRVDASKVIGTGHIFRTRNLARELKSRGSSIYFICRSQPGDLIDLLAQEFPVLRLETTTNLDKADSNPSDLAEYVYHPDWLCCSQTKDATDTLTAIYCSAIDKIDCLVVDHYSIDCLWQTTVINSLASTGYSKPSLMVIDDLANRKHIADILVDQNYYGVSSHTRYQDLIPSSCKYLSGPHYALLSPEYSLLNRSAFPRTKLNRILIFFGGSDLKSCTLLAVKALATNQFRHVQIDVILGFNSPDREAICSISSNFSNISIYNTMPSLAGMYYRADLVIGAGGVTTWERCCLSVPSLVIIIAENQQDSISCLCDNSSIQLLGIADEVSLEDIRESITNYDKDFPLVSAGSEFVDGYGVPRVANSLLGTSPVFTLRKVEYSDKYLLWRWANDYSVRSNSFSPNPISLSDHEAWFSAGLNCSNRLHLIAIDIHGCPFGQIRFDKVSSKRSIFIDFSLDVAARGQGLASKLLIDSLDLIPVGWTDGFPIVACVKDSNHSSYSSFRRAGFRPYRYGNDDFTTFVLEFDN